MKKHGDTCIAESGYLKSDSSFVDTESTDIEIVDRESADTEKEEHHGLQTGIRHTGYRTELAAAA